jgi:threonine dehydrogenase-like Zn-dependent dehydrogenase
MLIRGRAFRLNCSKLFARLGYSPGVAFKHPRDQGGRHCCGRGEFSQGQAVATVMGGTGRAFDGGHAEYTCVPAERGRALRNTLRWEVLGALPEMLQTARGALFRGLVPSA